MRHLPKDPLGQPEGRGSSLFCSLYILGGHKLWSKYLLCFFLSKNTFSVFCSYVCTTATGFLRFCRSIWLLLVWLKVNVGKKKLPGSSWATKHLANMCMLTLLLHLSFHELFWKLGKLGFFKLPFSVRGHSPQNRCRILLCNIKEDERETPWYSQGLEISLGTCF